MQPAIRLRAARTHTSFSGIFRVAFRKKLYRSLEKHKPIWMCG